MYVLILLWAEFQQDKAGRALAMIVSFFRLALEEGMSFLPVVILVAGQRKS
jgi:hypothetical protein